MINILSIDGYLYVSFLKNDKKIEKNTFLKDNRENRLRLENEIIPELILTFNITVENFAKTYLKYKIHLKTYQEIKKRVEKFIIPQFGKYKVTDLKVYILKDWISKMSEDKSFKTIRKYVTDLKGILDVAIEYQLIDKNPFDIIKIPKHTKEETEPFSPKEVELILKNSSGFFQNFLAFSFYTGARVGEILALTLEDIKDDFIFINKSVSNCEISTPKTEKSIREISILNDLKPYLQNQIILAKQANSKYLFFTKDNTHFNSSNHIRGNTDDGRWVKILNKANVPYRKIYATRHTFIVSLLNSGTVSIMDIAKIVGHTSPQMIIQHYAKFIKSEKVKLDLNLKLY